MTVEAGPPEGDPSDSIAVACQAVMGEADALVSEAQGGTQFGDLQVTMHGTGVRFATPGRYAIGYEVHIDAPNLVQRVIKLTNYRIQPNGRKLTVQTYTIDPSGGTYHEQAMLEDLQFGKGDRVPIGPETASQPLTEEHLATLQRDIITSLYSQKTTS